MICPRCNCGTEKPHTKAEECLASLVEWRREADVRLIEYEERSVERQTKIDRLQVSLDGAYETLRKNRFNLDK